MGSAPRFCIDESTLFQLSGDPGMAIVALGPLVGLCEVAVSHKGGPPEIVDGVYAILSNVSGREFADILFQEVMQIDRDFVRRVEVLLDRCTPYSPQRPTPVTATVAVGTVDRVVQSHAC